MMNVEYDRITKILYNQESWVNESPSPSSLSYPFQVNELHFGIVFQFLFSLIHFITLSSVAIILILIQMYYMCYIYSIVIDGNQKDDISAVDEKSLWNERLLAPSLLFIHLYQQST